MKIRSSFVTNSSSSSYICEVCGGVESGYDMCLSDANMVECENGHVFCRGHNSKSTVDELDTKKMIAKFRKNIKFKNVDFEKLSDVGLKNFLYTNGIVDFEDYGTSVYNADLDENEYFDESAVSEFYCPICQMEEIPEHMMIKYLMKKYATSTGQIQKEISSKYTSYSDFAKDVK